MTMRPTHPTHPVSREPCVDERERQVLQAIDPGHGLRSVGALRSLHDHIASGHWPLGTKIPRIPELSEELGAGRSSIREAVSTLSHLGMLAPLRGAGTFVRSATAVPGVIADFGSGYSLPDILAAKRGIEVEASRLAARHRTEQDVSTLRAADQRAHAAPCRFGPHPFHEALLQIAGLRLLVDLDRGINERIRHLRVSPAVLDRSGGQRWHDDLIEAIALGDEEAAAAGAAVHASAAEAAPFS